MNQAQNAPEPIYSFKRFYNLPCAHRQHRHSGNCALVHGYSRSVEFKFGAANLDSCGFVVDFGQLGWLKDWLEMMFDHTLLLSQDDPLLPEFYALERAGACVIRLMPHGVGMEGSAQYVCEHVDHKLREVTKGRCWVESVTCYENDKNWAVYNNPDAGFRGWL